jgi:tRNA-dihydrouridine synthase
MVQLGAIIQEKDVDKLTHDPRFVVAGEEAALAELLREEVRTVREALRDVVICWNTAAGDEDSAGRFAAIAAEAGADLYELNANGGYGKLIKRHIIRALILPHNRPSLLEWLERLTEVSPIPVVLKFYGGMHGLDYVQLVKDVSNCGLFAIHVNVRHPTEFRPNVELVRELRPHFPGLMFCSGRVTTVSDVWDLYAAGADSVGAASGLVREPNLISKLALSRKLAPSDVGAPAETPTPPPATPASPPESEEG